MRAVALSEFGGPEVLAPGDWPDPVQRPGWVVVELRAAALNWHDCLVRQGVHDVELPQILGADGAGTRRDTGEDVVVFPSLWWGSDERFPCADFQILGDHLAGTYAELVAVPEENVFPKPAQLTWPEAAALPVAGTTAFRALFTRGTLKEGETVLVLGAGSGLSTIAVSLARVAGARVLVTSSSSAKLERAAELGAAGGALYTDDDWPEQIRQLAGGDGVDLVIDSVGSTWAQSLSVLRPGGRLVSLGATHSDQATVSVRPFYFGQYSIMGTTMGSPRDFVALMELIARNARWRPIVDTVIPLDDAAVAHAQMERREHFGKLVLSTR
jgi:NADPH:quinone reductase-like Zn-dependent oxidoreductase